MLGPLDLLGGVVVFFAAKLALEFVVDVRNGFSALRACPGRHILWINPFRSLSLVTASFFPPRGWLAYYGGKFTLYAKTGSTALSGYLIWERKPNFWFADAETLRIVTSDRHLFRKETEAYEVLEVYGPNLITTGGLEWRRHRAVAGPAFNEATYALTWAETIRIANEWFAELDEQGGASGSDGSGALVHTVEVMTKATLLIISAAGFGQRTSWSAYSTANQKAELASYDLSSPSSAASAPLLPFHLALALSIEKLFVKILTPDAFYSLPFRVPWLSAELDTARVAFGSLRAHMLELVAAARAGVGEKELTRDANILSRLVRANENEAAEDSGTEDVEGGESKAPLRVVGKRTVTDDELLSDIFAFLLAGHETSAHTLSFTFILLALYPDVQRKVREEVFRVWPDANAVLVSSYKEDFPKLEYALATFRETLRCFPAEPRLNKIATADTVLPTTRFAPEPDPRIPDVSYDGDINDVELRREERVTVSVPVPAGSVVTMDIWALHMNPFVWGDDAHLFRPERFIDTETYKWPRDGFLAFSAGARACIGQRFSIAESVCVLALVVRRYEILLPDETDQAEVARGPSEELKRKILQWTTGVTITPTNANVRLRRLAV